jgi:hypothetical protein
MSRSPADVARARTGVRATGVRATGVRATAVAAVLLAGLPALAPRAQAAADVGGATPSAALPAAGLPTAARPVGAPDPADGVLPAATLGIRPNGGTLSLRALAHAEGRLRREVRWTTQFLERRTVTGFVGSARSLLGPGSAMRAVAGDVRLITSVPLAFGTANARTNPAQVRRNLRAVAAGAYDAAFRAVADESVAAGHRDAVIRLGWEFDGLWAPWSSRPDPAAFVAAWRRVHGVFRSRSAAFLFDWCSQRSAWMEGGRRAYPGDAYVDVMGSDTYWRAERQFWSDGLWELEFLPSLRDHQAFAVSRGKPVAYPEWGISSGDEPRFITAMKDWMASLPDHGPGSVLNQVYWDTVGVHDLDRYPRSLAAYLAAFGAPA